jgi:carbon storage regulator
MLVLSRKQGESIVIGRRVRVTVERVSGHRVCLTIDAPKDVPVDRHEVWLRKQQGSGLISTEAVD